MKKVFAIKYYYRTGDSFGLEDREDVLEYRWSDLDIAKENIRRIKEHYDWYRSIDAGDEVKRPSWHKKEVGGKDKDNTGILTLKADNGELYKLYAPWCGYFEALYRAEIIFDPFEGNTKGLTTLD